MKQNREQFQQQQNQDMLQGLLSRTMSSGQAGSTASNVSTNANMAGIYERPPSSASTSSHSQLPRADGGALTLTQPHQMMPPPPPRPTTAQSQGHHSRPSTALSHHSPTSGMHPSLPLQRPPSRSQQQMPRPPSRSQQFQAAQQTIQRPPSRAQHQQQMPGVGGTMNGYVAKVPQSQSQSQQGQPFPGISNSSIMQSPVQQQFSGSFSQHSQMAQQFGAPQIPSGSHTFASQGSPSPTAVVPGSPLRGAKRKLGVEGSPRLGTGFQGGNAMGPPTSLPRAASEGLTQVGQIAGMGGMTINSMNNMNQAMNVNGMFPAMSSQSPRPGSASGVAPGIHQNLMDVSMSPGTNVMPTMDSSNRSTGLGLSLGPDIIPPGGRGSQPQPIQPSHSRQTSMPPQFPTVPSQNAASNMPLVQQHMRQGSLPPSAGVLNNVPAKSEMRSSVPPVPTLAAGSGTLPPTVSGTPSSSKTAPASSQGPPLPPGVNPAITRITLVPLADSAANVPDLTDEEIEDIQGWMKIDKEYDAVWHKMKERMEEEEKEVFGPRNLPWWEKGSLAVNMNRYRRGRENFDIRYPRKPKDTGQRRKGVRREGFKL